MLDKSCLEFIELLKSKEPVPGGGGACAFVGALSACLGNMVGNLTLGKKKYKDVEEDIKEFLCEGEEIIKEFQQLVSKDAEAFYPLSQAYSLPKGTDEEKLHRDKVLQEALIGATVVPMEIAKCCCKSIDLLEKFGEKGTRIAISDVGVGAYFAKAALLGARLNVIINTGLMKDKALKEGFEKEMDELLKNYTQKADRICAGVEKAIVGGE